MLTSELIQKLSEFLYYYGDREVCLQDFNHLSKNFDEHSIYSVFLSNTGNLIIED